MTAKPDVEKRQVVAELQWFCGHTCCDFITVTTSRLFSSWDRIAVVS